MEPRLKLAESVVLQSILDNVQGFPSYKDGEMKQLESVQLNVLTDLLELPKNLPYCALLMAARRWPMNDTPS